MARKRVNTAGQFSMARDVEYAEILRLSSNERLEAAHMFLIGDLLPDNIRLHIQIVAGPGKGHVAVLDRIDGQLIAESYDQIRGKYPWL